MWLDENGYKTDEVLVGNGFELEGKLWCICANFNGMFCLDLLEARVEKKISFYYKDDVGEKQHLYSGILKVEDSLYLVPYRGKDMVRYNVKSDEIKYIDFRKTNTELKVESLFIAGCNWKHYLFLFPYDYSDILRFDTRNQKVVALPMPENGKGKLPFIRRCAVRGHYIWITEDGGNRILKVNTEKLESRWIDLPHHLQICDLCLDKEQLFCLDVSGKIVIFNIMTEEITTYADVKSDKYSLIEKTKNYIWLIPNRTNRIARYSEKNGMEKINYPSNFVFSTLFLDEHVRTFSNIYSNELSAVIMPRCNNVLIKINKITEEVSFNNIVYSRVLKQEMQKEFFTKLKDGICVSDKDGNMKWFLSYINSNYNYELTERNNEYIGNSIYKIVTDN